MKNVIKAALIGVMAFGLVGCAPSYSEQVKAIEKGVLMLDKTGVNKDAWKVKADDYVADCNNLKRYKGKTGETAVLLCELIIEEDELTESGLYASAANLGVDIAGLYDVLSNKNSAAALSAERVAKLVISANKSAFRNRQQVIENECRGFMDKNFKGWSELNPIDDEIYNNCRDAAMFSDESKNRMGSIISTTLAYKVIHLDQKTKTNVLTNAFIAVQEGWSIGNGYHAVKPTPAELQAIALRDAK